MRVKTNDKMYLVKFNHYTPPDGVVESAKKFIQTHQGKELKQFVHSYKEYGTYCFIKVFEEGKKTEEMPILSEGQSILNALDFGKFNKKVGKKIALTKALKGLSLPKEYRQMFWSVYLAENKH